MREGLRADFEAFARDPAVVADGGSYPGGADEVTIACLVARLFDDSVREAALRSDLEVLAAAGDAAPTPWQGLAALGFSGNLEDYESLHNSNLSWVIAHRSGIPITLGIVLMDVARLRGLSARGVNFPGHFLVEVEGVIIDPFVMDTVDVAAALARQPAAARSLPPERLFVPAPPLAVGLRMLNNVKAALIRTGTDDLLLDVIDAQLALAPGEPVLLLERGDWWRRLGVLAPARQAYREALNAIGAGGDERSRELRGIARARLAAAEDGDPTRH